MHRIAVAFNLLYLAGLVFAVLWALPGADYSYDPEYGTPPAVVGAWLLGLGTIVASPAALSLYALVTQHRGAVNLAYVISLLGVATCGLLSLLGLMFWWPAYSQHHYSDEGGAAGVYMMLVGLPIALVCGVSFLALRDLRRQG